jgi:PAT family beta-lactamase induction signal transducer AmpG
MLVGGAIVERLGRSRTIIAGSLLLGAASVAMGSLPQMWSVGLTTQVYISAYVLLDVLATIAFLALMMAICWQRVGATQFSLYMAIANMGLSSGSALLGPLQSALSYPPLFLVAAGFAATVIALVWRLDLPKHRERVQTLESGHG